MQVQKIADPYYCPNSNIFKMDMYVEASKSGKLEEAEPAAFSSTRSRYALYESRCQAADNMQQARTRLPRSQSSPERISESQSPRRTRSPSSAGLRDTTVCIPPAILSPLLYSNVAVAFYSPRPPSVPMYLLPLPSNPELLNGAKIKEKKSMSKKSKKVVQYVMRTILRGVYKVAAIRAMPPERAPGISSVTTEDISPPKTSGPVFHSVASQTKPKSHFNRPSAAAVTDEFSNSSEECCEECDATCEWAGNVRALRESHVRLVLRQLQQLRDIERLDRTLHRAHASPPAQALELNVPNPASSLAQSACLLRAIKTKERAP
ncbi:uncharacterized protein LOC123880472 isoform X2 [Maniola jurtina]|uniref:uncharacterized protein LOC123880472 isoform X2 n=1 Tax=Maniola jurtina TaxID=191418 RepID=UPI001E68E7C0|nr:uncharacterized protein LOC123880472 isoform X2 [Maniola jurtina]